MRCGDFHHRGGVLIGFFEASLTAAPEGSAEEQRHLSMGESQSRLDNLETVPADTTSESHVTRGDGDALCVLAEEVGVFEEGDEVRFCSFL